jgi:hypothetical protein
MITMLAGSALFQMKASAQETTGGLSGTVKDPSGAVVVGAKVEVNGSALIGSKQQDTNNAGQYKFINLPPGTYVLTVKAPDFDTARAENISIGIGRYPTLDVSLKIGVTGTTVEVSAEQALIEQTATHALTNIDAEVIETLPHGSSYQSLITLAPSARTEPLQDSGYQINGGANAENSYLIEGQETASVVNGTSIANVPIEFTQEVQVKTSGIEAQYQGSMSGTVNVVLKKGSDRWHGTFFNYFNADYFDPVPHGSLRYDPNSNYTPGTDQSSSYNGFDTSVQTYVAKKDYYRSVQPGGQVGGPILKNRLWANVAFAPDFYTNRREVNFGSSTGNQTFYSSNDRYYFNTRLDGAVNSRIRVFATWLTQYYRSIGNQLPNADSINGLVNSSVSSGVSAFPGGIGTAQPNQNVNVGADITISQKLFSTTRFGHFFNNYGDRGWATAPVYYWNNAAYVTSGGATTYLTDLEGSSLEGTDLDQPAGYQTAALDSIYSYNATKHDQFTQDIELFKSSFFGTHDFKFGYGLNHLYNNINEGYNGPYTRVYPGQTHTVSGDQGSTNCASIEATNLTSYGTAGGGSSYCRGLDGILRIRDYGVSGAAQSYNHGFYVQDNWQVRPDLTVNLGVRFDKEYLPAYPNMKATSNPIDFGWANKIGPRAGVAWNVFGKDKLKVSAGYGKFYDQMKLSVAIDSFGGAFWHDCWYALDTTDYSSIVPAYASNGHYCSGTGDANFSGGVPSTVRFIENLNYRASALETVDPNLKPYSQHETTFGFEYQINPQWVLTSRWDRRRLDHIIEDAGILDADGNETFSIVNPGEGIDRYITGCSACSTNIKAARSYDGIEFLLKHQYSRGFQGNISYTYSRLRGNYSGLTNTDIADGGEGGRESANDNRSFDEPYFEYDAYGRSANGNLATDRPHALKIDGSYRKRWNSKHSTGLGIFEQAFSGSPLSSYADVGEPSGYPVYVEGRGKWVDVSTDANGFAIWGKVSDKRTDVFLQTDGNLHHTFSIDDRGHAINFEAIVTNLFNQRVATRVYSQINSANQGSAIFPSGDSIDYYTLTHKYDYQALFNEGNVLVNSTYGKPYSYQTARTIRVRIAYTF